MLKEKIKGVKARLKIWNKEQFGDAHQKVATIEKELNRLESEGEDKQLSGQELLVRKKLQEELWAAAQAQESLMRQKAKARWIKEGDSNSKFFHRVVNSNRKSNTLRGVLVNGVWRRKHVCSSRKNFRRKSG